MKKRGFTLVEMLAVIVILAVLAIIAVPNIMGMFNEAKRKSFLTEVREIYRSGEKAWIRDAMRSSGAKEYGKCNGCSYKQLGLDTRNELDYYIALDKKGKVKKLYATDGTYQVTVSNYIEYENLPDPTPIVDLRPNEIIKITPTGIDNDSVSYIEFTIITQNFEADIPDVTTIYRAEVGMTWEDWLDSELNYNDISFNNSHWGCSNKGWSLTANENIDSVYELNLQKTDLIQENTTYYLQHFGECV